MAAIFVISASPSVATSLEPVYDFSFKKLAHVVVYGILTALLFRRSTPAHETQGLRGALRRSDRDTLCISPTNGIKRCTGAVRYSGLKTPQVLAQGMIGYFCPKYFGEISSIQKNAPYYQYPADHCRSPQLAFKLLSPFAIL